MFGGSSTEVALWYWRYRQMDYDLWDNEEMAAGIAAAMLDDGGGVPAGIQFPDGHLIPADEWDALAAARDQRLRADQERVPEKPRPKRKIRAPFGGGGIEIDADGPQWLGETP